MAGIIAGVSSKVAAAPQPAWGTKAVAMSTRFSFTSETLKLIKDKKSEDALVGAKTTGRMDSMGRKVEGDISGLVRPDEIGYFLAATLGVEATPAAQDAGSSCYLHEFTPVAPGSANTLYPLTIVVDRVIKHFAYEGCKVNTLKLDAQVGDYLRAVMTLRGRDEVESTSVTYPARSTLKAFKFIQGSVTAAGSSLVEVTGADVTINNNLEDNLYVMDGSEQMAEIEPQKREITGTLNCLRTTQTETIRSSYFNADTPLSVVLEFESDEVLAASYPYKLTITFPNAYLSEDPSQGVSGPERLKLNFALMATEQNGTEAVVVDLYDGKSTKYNIA